MESKVDNVEVIPIGVDNDDVEECTEFDIDSLLLSVFTVVELVTAVVAETMGLVRTSDSIDVMRSV